MLALLIPLTYLAASVNFSILVFKLLGRGDPRDRFSGNPGATNVKRQLGLFWAVVVLVLDLGRAAGLAWLCLFFLPVEQLPLVGFSLIVGNRYPVFHGFKGGKGVANYLGFTCVTAPWAALVSCLAWVSVYEIVKLPFVGSFIMVTVLGVGAMNSGRWQWPAVVGSVLTMVFIFYNHRSNIMAWRASKSPPS